MGAVSNAANGPGRCGPTKKSALDPDSGPCGNSSLLPWGVFLFVLLAFLLALKNQFIIYDDSGYVYDNPHVRHGISWESVRWAFGHTYYSNWHPLTWISHMLDCQFFGANPWGHHLTNVLLHAFNSVLLYLLLRGMTGATWRSAVVAALFGVHPLRVESVAWVAERKDALCAFFFMLSLLAYAKYSGVSTVEERQQLGSEMDTENPNQKSKIKNRKSAFYLLSLVFFALGLMSKAMIVTLPFVLLLIDFWPLGRVRLFGPDAGDPESTPLPKLVVEKAPFFALTLVSCIVTFAAQKASGAVRTMPLSLRLENATVAVWRYVGKVFWPIDLSIFYPFRDSLPVGEWSLAAAALLIVSVMVIRLARRCEYLAVGWLWFLGMLIPVIGLVQVGGQSMADRYSYLPSIGLAIVLVWGAWDLAARVSVPRWAGAGVAVAVLALLVTCTERQLGFWKDSETLFRHALAVTDHNGPAHGILGVALAEKQDYAEAEVELRKGLELEPRDALFHYRLGAVMLKEDRLQEAISELETSLQLKPDFPNADNRLGVALLRAGRSRDAIPHLQAAATLQPSDSEIHYFLGGALADSGRLDEGVSQFNEALQLKPDLADAHNDLSRALERQGHLAEAIQQSELAVQLRPDNPDYHNNLGTSLAKAGRLDDAATQFRKTLALKPTEIRAAMNLAAVLKWKSSSEQPNTDGNAAAKP